MNNKLNLLVFMKIFVIILRVTFVGNVVVFFLAYVLHGKLLVPLKEQNIFFIWFFEK